MAEILTTYHSLINLHKVLRPPPPPPPIYLVEIVMAESIQGMWRRSELLISHSQIRINSSATPPQISTL